MREETSELDTSIDEWREALEVSDDEGQTVGELAEATGLPESTLRDKLKKLIKEGKCVKGTAVRNIEGRRGRWNVYHLMGEEK